MTNTRITLVVNNAPEMDAYVAMPEGVGPFPAMIVFQEGFGVNGHIRGVANRLAKEGYVAIAPELFHRTAPAGYEPGYDFAVVGPHFQAITIENLEADTQAAYDWLLGQSNVQQNKIGCIGFCMGGRVSFIANTFLPFAAAVSFYAGGVHTAAKRAPKMQAPQLFFWGGKDAHILPAHRDTIINAIQAAGKDYVNVVISDADHGFFNEERPAYNHAASQEAWALVSAFLKNKFGMEQ
jgi:carboxymethylenebutenolidase